MLLRPSSTKPDAKLDPMDVWVWTPLAERGTQLTGYTAHGVYDDFTWDPKETLSGAADDWAYEHLGVYGWTTEFWDIVQQATGTKQSTHFWYTGPTDDEALAVLRWCDANHPEGYVEWYRYDHPTLGPVELGGWNDLSTWGNPPTHLLEREVAPHADFAVHQALCSPLLEIPHVVVHPLGIDTWRVEVGIANTGWLPTDISRLARNEKLVAPIVADMTGDGIEVLDGIGRRTLGQLEGRAALRFRHGNDGTPDRALVSWVVRGAAGSTATVNVSHDRAGRVVVEVPLPSP